MWEAVQEKNDIQVVVQMVPILRKTCKCIIEPCTLRGMKGSPLLPAQGTNRAAATHEALGGGPDKRLSRKLHCKNIWFVFSYPSSFPLASSCLRRHFYLLTSLSSCSCKTAHRWGSALTFLLPHRQGISLKSAHTLNASSFLSLLSLKHTASTFPPKMERGTSEWVSEKQKPCLEFHIQAESQLNEELIWYQTRSHHFCKTLVHYVGIKFQE